MEILSTRPDGFPAGLRVLVVDDDPTWLKILEKMLRKCSYEVTTCGLARVALEMLRERRDRFDIVISDVNMPDMDGFKLLEQVGLEMDLPVIMMSVDGETSRVMKGVQHGACDYLLKPVRMKELKNIWQHVFRKRINEMRDFEYSDGNEDFQMFRNKSDYMDGRNILCGGDLNSLRKRKDATSKELAARHLIDPCSPKRARVVWSVDLHQKFVNAVNQIGFEKVGPKKILDLMNVPGLTRENVASHLQKYRLYLSRLQKQNEGMASAGTLQAELTKDLMGNLSFPISSGSPRKDSSFQNHPTKHTREQSTISEADAVNYMIMAPQAEDIKMHLIDGNNCHQHQKAKTNLNAAHFTRGMEENVEQKLQRSSYAMGNHIWNEDIAQSGNFPGKEQHIFDPLSALEHIHQLGGSNVGDHLSTFITPASATSWAEPCSLLLKQMLPDCESSYSSSTPAARSATNLISVKLEPRDENPKHLFASSEVNVCSIPSRFPDQYLIDSVECTHRKNSSIEELVVYSSLESPSFRHGSLTTFQTELPDSTGDGSHLDYEYNFEWMGLPATDSGLFT